MKAPKNRRVFVVGYDAATALGNTFTATWQAAIEGQAGFRRVTRCATASRSNVVGKSRTGTPASSPMWTGKRPRSGMPPMSS